MTWMAYLQEAEDGSWSILSKDLHCIYGKEQIPFAGQNAIVQLCAHATASIMGTYHFVHVVTHYMTNGTYNVGTPCASS